METLLELLWSFFYKNFGKDSTDVWFSLRICVYVCIEKKTRRTYTKVSIAIFGDWIFFILFPILKIFCNEHIVYNQENTLSGSFLVRFIIYSRISRNCWLLSRRHRESIDSLFLSAEPMLEPDTVLKPISLNKCCFN